MRTVRITADSPYGFLARPESDPIVDAFNKYVSVNHPGCPTLVGKISVDGETGEVIGSTPHAIDILGKVVSGDLAKKLGVRIATPIEKALLYNQEKERVEAGAKPEDMLFYGKNWFDSGMWLISPFAKYQKENENAWNFLLADNVFRVMGGEGVFAVPGEAINYLQSREGQIPVGYIAEGKKGLVVPLDWNEEDVRNGFSYHTFDLRIGVPNKSSTEKKMSRFVGMRQDLAASALYVNDDLGALAYRYFDNTDRNARVVGMRTGEASSQ